MPALPIPYASSRGAYSSVHPAAIVALCVAGHVQVVHGCSGTPLFGSLTEHHVRISYALFSMHHSDIIAAMHPFAAAPRTSFRRIMKPAGSCTRKYALSRCCPVGIFGSDIVSCWGGGAGAAPANKRTKRRWSDPQKQLRSIFHCTLCAALPTSKTFSLTYYTVCGDALGCVSATSAPVQVIHTGVAAQTATSFRLVPNPASDLVRIERADATRAVITVLDVQGRTVLETSITGPSAMLDVSGLKGGVYVVWMEGHDRQVERLVVE